MAELSWPPRSPRCPEAQSEVRDRRGHRAFPIPRLLDGLHGRRAVAGRAGHLRGDPLAELSWRSGIREASRGLSRWPSSAGLPDPPGVLRPSRRSGIEESRWPPRSPGCSFPTGFTIASLLQDVPDTIKEQGGEEKEDEKAKYAGLLGHHVVEVRSATVFYAPSPGS